MMVGLLLLPLACAQLPTQPVELHGSGTTNPSKYIWKTMDLFEERAKIPLYMTYRAVGSSTGQEDFVGADHSNVARNHFGSGDIPMSASNFQTLTDAGREMVHIPFVVGAIAVFHSVPGVSEDTPIDLDACTLAKVFARTITTWDDPAIKALNPTLEVPVGAPINVLHRVHGSSSTAGLTNYLEKATKETGSTCTDAWPLGACKTCAWASDTTGVEGSGNMAKTLDSTPYSIGYLDAGHGHSEGFPEIALKNKAGNYLTSKAASIGAAGSQAQTPASSSADWSAVNLYDMDGDVTWPIAMFSYFYLEKDCSGMESHTAALLKAFVEYTLSPEGQASLEGFRFTGVTQDILDKNAAALLSITWPSPMPVFTFETAESTQKQGVGAGSYVLSGKRKTYADVARDSMMKDIAGLQTKVALLEERLNAKAPVQLHGAGTTNPSKFIWKAMDLFEERAKIPLFMTYRAVGSSTGQHEFVGADNGNKPFNHFGAGDIPMKSSNYAALEANGGNMVHIPFVMGAIAVFHSVPDTDPLKPIHLDACTLAKVFSRQIKTWDHADIKAINTGILLPSNEIVVVHRVHGSSSTSGLTNYLKKSCPASWTDTAGEPLDAGSSIDWPTDTATAEGSGNMAKTLATTPYAIGYLDAGHGHSEGFAEIALENKNKKYLTSKDAVIADAGAQALAPPSVIPSDPSADFSSVDLYDLAGDKTWPITMFSYFYIQKDCSKMDPRTAGLLKAFIEYTLSLEGQDGLRSFSFSGVPQEILTYNAATLSTAVTWPTDMVSFEFELGSTTRKGDGAKPYVLSGKRKTYADVARDSMMKDIDSLQALVNEDIMAEMEARIAALEARSLNRVRGADPATVEDLADASDVDISSGAATSSVLGLVAALFLARA